MTELDYEKIRLLGRYQVIYRADTGLFYSRVKVPQDIKDQIRVGNAYGEIAQFLAKGNDAVSSSTALRWWSCLRQETIAEGNCVPLEDKNIYESIQLNWNEKDICITDSCTDMEMRELRGPKGSNLSVFFPYDPTLSKEERDYMNVTYWLVDWAKHRVFSYESGMSDSYEVRLTAFPLIRAMGSLEEALRWRDAMTVYKKAQPHREIEIG